MRLGASYAAHDIDITRTVTIRGFADKTSTSYDGWTAQAFGEFGYQLNLGSVTIEPVVNVSIRRSHTDGFVENGGASALAGYAQDYNLGTTTLGVRAEARLSADVPPICVVLWVGGTFMEIWCCRHC
ncbi:autotransporter outer membrane beta-barrel domain-containing protein [Microvirga puerhi]|uniref:autotransporter outer membrane beta-barrel domain-containing protein n=1 Tax=Microvirga puerhi TaxID=2876078 RepID=UPI0021039C6D|nr:autotransporter outer membrane beta-barrel domain-containing protein [Microvirga puerhi]